MGELRYRITDPGFTIYDRAALGGLAATIYAWERYPERYPPPAGITAEFDASNVRLAWADDIGNQTALRRLLEASFRLTGDGMIDLPGLQVGRDGDELRLAIHSGILGTFLQHPKMRPGPKEPGRIEIRSVDDDAGRFFSFKRVDAYAHQRAQGTALLDPPKRGLSPGAFPPLASLPQWCVPGALAGASEIAAATDRVILLHFLVVGAPVFLLRSRFREEKARKRPVKPGLTARSQWGTMSAKGGDHGEEKQGRDGAVLPAARGGARRERPLDQGVCGNARHSTRDAGELAARAEAA